MTSTLTHRGPDDAGVWTDEEAGVFLGHRRLSILDLSAAGHQPMQSPSGRYVVTFNGEIYNHRDLRRDLERSAGSGGWRGHSDTEVLVAAMDAWGIEEAVRKSNGMFAFAVWDRRDRTLYLARDRMGEKPLYYGTRNGVFLFASELKAISAHPAFTGEIDRAALALFLRHNNVPAPFSIWKGIRKLPPAHILAVRGGDSDRPPECYWNLEELAREGRQRHSGGGDTADLTEELDALLRDSVALRMEADVPLGAFLSGGIDSSVIVSIMQAQSSRRVRTFSIGFKEQAYDEARYAEAVARHLGTDHTELYVGPRDALEVIPRLPVVWDEPFSDSSQIPTLLLSELTRAHVKVSLSGDGGDELFGGYERYFRAAKLWRFLSRIPLRAPLASALGSRAAVHAASTIDRLWPKRGLSLGHRVPLLAALVGQRDQALFYRHFISHWKDPAQLVLGGEIPAADEVLQPGDFDHFLELMMYQDMVGYLPDDILTKVDRASMAVGLEARVPFLDHRLVEFSWRVPLHEKVQGDTGKRILRSVLYKYVPRDLVDRPKRGFALPIDEWLKGELRAWAEDLLAPRRLREDGFFRPEPIRRKWTEHLKGNGQWHFYLWDVLMFQAWWQQQRTVTAPLHTARA